jgi:plastocyanin
MRQLSVTILTISALWAAVAALSGAASAEASQGTGAPVSGQVTIQERAGDETEDLGNVVVFLEPAVPVAASARAKSGPPPVKTVIALQSRQFSPRIRVVTEGSTVEFPNQDPFSHNVFSKTNGGFDTGVYGRGKAKDQKFEESGVYSLYCNVHPRMTAFVITLATPYFTQAGADGRFVLEKVPPGNYRMHVWHDRATEVVRDVIVPATGLTGQRIDLDARGYKYVQHKNKFGKDYTSTTGDRY